jgi:hypothetical protein
MILTHFIFMSFWPGAGDVEVVIAEPVWTFIAKDRVFIFPAKQRGI